MKLYQALLLIVSTTVAAKEQNVRRSISSFEQSGDNSQGNNHRLLKRRMEKSRTGSMVDIRKETRTGILNLWIMTDAQLCDSP